MPVNPTDDDDVGSLSHTLNYTIYGTKIKVWHLLIALFVIGVAVGKYAL